MHKKYAYRLTFSTDEEIPEGILDSLYMWFDDWLCQNVANIIDTDYHVGMLEEYDEPDGSH